MDDNDNDATLKEGASEKQRLEDETNEEVPIGEAVPEDGLLYHIRDTPAWPVTLVYAIQQAAVTSAGGPLVMAFMVYGAICGDDDVLFAQLVSTTLFMCGVCTIVQILFGVRLPIKQGSSWTFIGPIMAMMSTEQWRCPDVILDPINNATMWNDTIAPGEPLWRPRLLHISGGIILSSLVQVFLGFTGLVGLLMNFIGPLTIIPTVSLIGLSLYHGMIKAASTHWGISMMSMCLFMFITLFLENIQVPYVMWSRKKKWHKKKYPVFKVFPLLIAMAISWLVCLILTESGFLTSDTSDPAYNARTDARSHVISKMNWFYFPYPGQWGTPTFGPAIFLGTLAATLSSIVESVGDYYATAAICSVPPPPHHALSRGILIEGLGAVLCGFMGICHATTSYSDSMGFIAITGMSSRLVWLMMGVVLVLFGVIGKVGALLSCIPDPVMGGISIPALGMVTAVAFLNLRHVNMRKSRNLMILGVSHLLGIAIPDYLMHNPGTINTGNSDLDQVLSVFLSTSIFLGGFIGFTLDNIVPGTKEDRGLVSFNQLSQQHQQEQDDQESPDHQGGAQGPDPYAIYDLPLIGPLLDRFSVTRYIPICPAYKNKQCCSSGCCCRRRRPGKGGRKEEGEGDLAL